MIDYILFTAVKLHRKIQLQNGQNDFIKIANRFHMRHTSANIDEVPCLIGDDSHFMID